MGMFSKDIGKEKDTIEKQYNTENASKPYFDLKGKVDRYNYRREGMHYVDIIPWRNSKGEWKFKLDTFVYLRLGVTKSDYLALAEYGKPDPVREEKQALEAQYGSFKEANEHGAKNFMHKKRCMYLVRPLDENGNPIKGAKLAVLEVGVGGGQMPGFPIKLVNKANACIKGAPVIDYADPDEGKTIAFNVVKSKYEGRDAYNIDSVDFTDRTAPVGMDFCKNHGINLEDFLVWPTYDELKEALFGGSATGAPADTTSQESAREEMESDEEANATSRTLKDDEGREYEDPFPDQPTEREEEYESDREEEREDDREEPKPELCSQGFPYGECMLKCHSDACHRCPGAEYSKCKKVRDELRKTRP